jgi:hypothetical protein
MTTNLKPCPFCGGKFMPEHPKMKHCMPYISAPITEELTEGGWRVTCYGCGIGTWNHLNYTKEQAIEAWNTRTHPISTELPTEPGPYWWREKDGSEWQSIIMMDGDWLFTYGPSMRTTEHCDMARFLVLHGIGQWIKIERPE